MAGPGQTRCPGVRDPVNADPRLQVLCSPANHRPRSWPMRNPENLPKPISLSNRQRVISKAVLVPSLPGVSEPLTVACPDPLFGLCWTHQTKQKAGLLVSQQEHAATRSS